MIQFSKDGEKYIIVTDNCQAAILLEWRRNQNNQPCGSLRKICKQLRGFENYTGVSPIRRQFAWLCKLLQGRSSCPTHHAPNKVGPFIPAFKRAGLSGPFSVKETKGTFMQVIFVGGASGVGAS